MTRATAGRTPWAAAGYRLCLVSDAREVGGAERFLTYLAAALPADVDVALLGAQADVLAAVAPPRARTQVVAPMTVRACREALRALDPDVVHANLIAFPSCRPAVLAALSLRLPVVLVDHLPTPGLTWRGRLLQRVVTRLCAARVAIGEGAGRLVERYGGLAPGTVLSIPNGVPPHAGPPRDGAPPRVLGVLCRLERQKGVDVLLRSLAGLPGVRLEVGGDGSERERLVALAAEVGVSDRVRFAGWVRDSAAFLDGVDVLVVPSRSESMPLVVLEAMHAGLPVVATRVGSLAEVVVDGGTGLLVDPEDAAGLATACRRLVEEPGLARRLGEAAAERAAERYADRGMAAAYDRLYRRVLRPRGP